MESILALWKYKNKKAVIQVVWAAGREHCASVNVGSLVFQTSTLCAYFSNMAMAR